METVIWFGLSRRGGVFDIVYVLTFWAASVFFNGSSLTC